MNVHGQEYEVDVHVALRFRASHALPMRPEKHEHDWEVEFTVSGPLNPNTGMVCDMLELHRFFGPLVESLDNTHLHDVPDFQQGEGLVGLTARYPTCDTLAHYFLWKTVPLFREESRFQGLRISRIKVSLAEPDVQEPWGHAVIRPKSDQ